MLTLLEVIIFLGILGTLAFYRVSSLVWTSVVAATLIVLTVLHSFAWVIFPLWILFIAAAVIFNLGWLRRMIFTPFILQKFRKVLPPISDTERAALEAGDVWWEGELFRGRPDWQKLLAMPKLQFTAEEQTFIDNQVETLCSMLHDWNIVEEKDLPVAVWNYLKKEKFFGLVIDKKYGGHGFSAYAHSAVVTKIATRSMNAAVTTMVPNSLGPAELIYHYGTAEQKNYYLPRLAEGKDIPCFGLTAPEAGSDAGGMYDSGIVCKGIYEGKEIIGMRLNWDKRYITLAPVATLLGIAFYMYDPEHLLGHKEEIGITLALIPANLPGIEIGDRHAPMRLAFMNGPVRGKDIFVPLDFIIGGPDMRGKGWRMLMEALSVGRGISIPSLATAVGKLCYRMTGAYARVRKQFNVSIGQFEGVAESLARIGGFTYLCEATRLLTLNGIDQGVKPSLATAMTKYHLTEMGRHIANDAMDIHAGRGIQFGPKNYLGIAYTCIPVSITVEGANILTRNLIIFGQGAVRCHPYVKDEIDATMDTDQRRGLLTFDKLLCSHIGFAISNLCRVFAYGISGGRWIKVPVNDQLAPYYRQLTRMSAALALTADLAMSTLGGKLKRRESLSARLGDILSQLYLASAVLKYYQDQQSPAADLPFVQWTLARCLYTIQFAFEEFLRNFALGKVLRLLIFPWGRSYKMPKDDLSIQLANALMQPSAQRDRLTQLCYVGKDNNDATGLMENAFIAMEQAEPVQAKLAVAKREGKIPKHAKYAEQISAAKQAAIISDAEITLLQNALDLCSQAIQVDEFKPNQPERKTNNARKQTELSA